MGKEGFVRVAFAAIVAVGLSACVTLPPNSPRSPQDPNVYLTITYKNMAALDGLEDRVEPFMKKIWASRDAAAKANADRESLREIIGTELIRKLELK